MSILTVTDLRENSERREGSSCWGWLNCKASDGSPRIWTLDYDRCDKRSMNGAKAVFYIAHRCPLNGRIAFRSCFNMGCVNPDHIRTAADKVEMGRIIAANGKRKGKSLSQRRANIAKAHAASGCIPTTREIVIAIRSAPAGINGRQLAAIHGINHRTVSRIRRFESHRDVA